MVRIFFGRVNIRSAVDQYPVGSHPNTVARKAAQEHKWAFSSLVSQLKEQELHEEKSEAESQLRREYKSEAYILDQNAVVCESDKGNMFALERNGRWLAMSAPEGARPREIADEVQEFLRGVGASAGVGGELTIDVDLVCSRRRLLRGIEALGTVFRFTITVKQPNHGDTYREPRRRMRALRAERLEEIYESKKGLLLSQNVIYNATAGAETGEIEVAAKSATGEQWALADNPEEYDVQSGVQARLSVLLLLALAWIVNNWPWDGSGGVH